MLIMAPSYALQGHKELKLAPHAHGGVWEARALLPRAP